MKLSNLIRKAKNNEGFSLLELAVVLLLTGMSMLMVQQLYKVHQINQKRQITTDHLKLAKTALWEFYNTQGRYPCPADPTLVATDADYGKEQCRSQADQQNNPDDCTGAHPQLACTTAFARDGDGNSNPDVVMIGVLPALTLFGENPGEGVQDTPFTEAHRLDGYLMHLSYAVTEHMTDEFEHSVANPANPNTGAIDVRDENGVNMLTPQASAHFTLFSHGQDSKGAYTLAGQRLEDCTIPSVPLDPEVMFAALRLPLALRPPFETAHSFSFIAADPGETFIPGTTTWAGDIENCDNNDAIFIQGVKSLGANINYNDDELVFNTMSPPPIWDNVLVGVPTGQTYMYNTNVGNVGIRTDDPTHKLHIMGDMKVETNVKTDGYCDGVDNNTCLIPESIAGAGTECPNPDEAAIAVGDNEIVCQKVAWNNALQGQECPPETWVDAGVPKYRFRFLVAVSNLGNIACTAHGPEYIGVPPASGGVVPPAPPPVVGGGSPPPVYYGKSGGMETYVDADGEKIVVSKEALVAEAKKLEAAKAIDPDLKAISVTPVVK